MDIGQTFIDFLNQSGFATMTWQQAVMIVISCVLLYLAIVKQFEPLLLLPIAFGMLLANLPGAGLAVHYSDVPGFVEVVENGTAGLLDYLYLGVKLGIYPPLIFLGVGAMTDFGPLIANPKSLLLGAAAQLGIFIALILALLIGFDPQAAASIGIIGGADGPTALFLTSKLKPELLGPIAVAAYSYMALIPIIQPPIMKAFTSEKNRKIEMAQLRTVSRREKIIFPIAITIFVSLVLPSAAVLVGMLMLGNLFRECGVVDRINKTAQNELMNIVTIFLGLSVGATATGETFLLLGDHQHYRPGPVCLCLCYPGRNPAGEHHVQADQGQGQPADWLRRRLCRAHGGESFPEGRAGGQSAQLPADARHGPQRGRRYRLSCGGGHPAGHVRLMPQRHYEKERYLWLRSI